jgi:hypothetical protein
MSNLEKLSLYHYNQDEVTEIKFDQYGRPYIQNNGKMMLSRRTGYEFTIQN